MICKTMKKGVECFFMTKKGCSYNGGRCYPVVERCEGCERIQEFPEGRFCSVFPDPAARWRHGNCSMATHIGEKKETKPKMINPIKASKRRYS